MGTARSDLWSIPRLLGLAAVVGVFAGAADLHATPMVFEVANHPDGATIGVNVNVDGHVLRLKLNSTAFDGGDNGLDVNAASAARGLTGSARFSSIRRQATTRRRWRPLPSPMKPAAIPMKSMAETISTTSSLRSMPSISPIPTQSRRGGTAPPRTPNTTK